MDTLDPEGLVLYQAYIKARDDWVAYIRPKAIQKLNDYLSSTGKKYYKYEYLHHKQYEYLADARELFSKERPKSKELEAKYKKLCILYHPDKFQHSSSGDLFCTIRKFYDDEDEVMLDVLDSIAYIILGKPPELTLGNIIANLKNVNITNHIKELKNFNNSGGGYKCDARELFEILNSSKPEEIAKLSNHVESSSNPDFLDTNAYKFFIDDKNMIKYIHELFITESELINDLYSLSEYDDSLLQFCMERYRDNENILRAGTDIQIKRNEKLQKENARLREQIDKIRVTKM